MDRNFCGDSGRDVSSRWEVMSAERTSQFQQDTCTNNDKTMNENNPALMYLLLPAARFMEFLW